MGSKVIDHVEVASLLQAVARFLKGHLGDLHQLLPTQQQAVALVGSLNLLQNVRVVGGVQLGLGAVDETLYLREGWGEGGTDHYLSNVTVADISIFVPNNTSNSFVFVNSLSAVTDYNDWSILTYDGFSWEKSGILQKV